jgi:Skp family chaperone for outer membrane proteins
MAHSGYLRYKAFKEAEALKAKKAQDDLDAKMAEYKKTLQDLEEITNQHETDIKGLQAELRLDIRKAIDAINNEIIRIEGLISRKADQSYVANEIATLNSSIAKTTTDLISKIQEVHNNVKSDINGLRFVGDMLQGQINDVNTFANESARKLADLKTEYRY